MALRWIMDATRKEKQNYGGKIICELMDASQNKGSAIKREKTLIRWQSQIKLLLTSDGNLIWLNIL